MKQEGVENFMFEVVEECGSADLTPRERLNPMDIPSRKDKILCIELSKAEALVKQVVLCFWQKKMMPFLYVAILML